MSAPPHNDKPAAFRGLIVTALILFVTMFAIVKWTNTLFASHEAAPAGAAKP